MADNLSSKLSLVPDARMRAALKDIMDGETVAVAETWSLGTVVAADADFLIKAATSDELPNNATITYLSTATNASPHDAAAGTTTIVPQGASTGVVVWDVRDGATYGRNLISVMTHDSAVVASTVTISGYDWTGQAMSELHTITASGTTKTVNGKKAFAYVKSVAIASAGNSTTNTLNVGTGAVLGLPYFLEKKGHMLNASIDGVAEQINVSSNATVVAGVTTSPATTITGDVRGTITFNGSLGVEALVTYYVSRRGTTSNIHGVTQV